jgi:hypothetical protein
MNTKERQMSKDLKDKILEEERWIDYLEGELEPSLAEDLERVLEHDEDLKALVGEYEGIKAYLGKLDQDELLPQEDDYYDQMSEKIMAKVSDSEVLPLPTKNFGRKNLQYFAAAVFLCVFSLSALMNSIESEKSSQQGDQVAKMSFQQLIKSAKVEDISTVQDTVISHESDMDFMMNADLDALNNLTDEELESLMGQL